MKVDLIDVSSECPVCPTFAVALEPAEYHPGRGFRISGVCDCGANLAAWVAVKGLDYSPPLDAAEPSGAATEPERAPPIRVAAMVCPHTPGYACSRRAPATEPGKETDNG